MKKILFFFIPFFLIGCTNEVTFLESDEPFLEYEYGSYGPDLIYNLYPIKIVLYSDGQANISTPIDNELGIDSDSPHTVPFTIETEAVDDLHSKIKESNFFTLPEDLSEMDTMDGGYQYLTVHTEQETKTVGGSNPNDETFNQLTAEIRKVIPEEVVQAFRENIEHYQTEQGLRE